MSKMLLPENTGVIFVETIREKPIELETAISPNPFFATITEVIKSGTEVPAAKNVSPITEVSIPITLPITSAIQTMI